MDEELKEALVIIISNNEIFDFKSSQNFYRSKEWEYEKRSISSLLIGSAGAISLLLALLNSDGFENSNFCLFVLTIVLFLVCLITTGLSQFILNEAASRNHLHYLNIDNSQSYSNGLEKFEKKTVFFKILSQMFPDIQFDREMSLKNKKEIEEKSAKFKLEADQHKLKAEVFETCASWLLIVAALSFAIGVIAAIFLIVGVNL